MDSRRDFLKKAALLATAGGLAGGLPGPVQRAFAIDPVPGSTFYDAEHVVILMQENRSFDHMYGMLRGVRGFNDPRALTLPDGNPVWLQTNEAGETYAPFRLNIRNTKITWMGSLPHSWVNQAEARNDGRHDRWLPAKASDHRAYAQMPLTLGYYQGEDLPFYYALADAFTICDQNFCSSLTATEPNRLHLWTGTVRARASMEAWAYVRNEDMGYDRELDWMTFPDRLEQNGISWRIYQNEISLPSGLDGEADAWLSSFDDNPLEYFTRYHVRFSQAHRRWLAATEKSLAAELERLSGQPSASSEQIAGVRARLDEVRRDLAPWTDAAFAVLPAHEQNLHRRAFTTNEGDPDYRELTSLTYRDGNTERTMQIPKGDVLYQFRQDVNTGKLPAVSWIVAPERFSDHPSSPWYGAWYVSEALDILTRNPEVWKKTIFLLCYDENDGYFDHVPPFAPPPPDRSDRGKVSAGIDVSVEHVSAEQEAEIRRQEPDWKGRTGPIGLGFRVPLVIASPWSRGGYVCSQVFDHTSILQFLETFLNHKTGRPIRETNISAWRRTVCGDLTSAFRPYDGQTIAAPDPLHRGAVLASINEAQYRAVPNDFAKLSDREIEQICDNPQLSPRLPRQEDGTRPACPLPYELAADGSLSSDRQSFVIRFSAGRELFGERAAGAPFRVYAPGKMRVDGDSEHFENGRAWDYAVSAGDRVSDTWQLKDFEAEHYQLCVYGPNGFFREFRGGIHDPGLQVNLRSEGRGNSATGNAELQLVNHDPRRAFTLTVDDVSYGKAQRIVYLAPAGSMGDRATVVLDLTPSFGWYDLRVRVPGAQQFEQRYAGRIENGRESRSDPLMGSEGILQKA